LPLFYFFINAAVVNAYRIQYIYEQQQGSACLPAQLQFREKLYQQLFAFASEINADLPKQRLDLQKDHRRISFNGLKTCVWCQYKKKKGQLNASRAGRSRSGCAECNSVALCLKTRCWMEFHSLKRLDS
jgi:hypothetical protein